MSRVWRGCTALHGVWRGYTGMHGVARAAHGPLGDPHECGTAARRPCTRAVATGAFLGTRPATAPSGRARDHNRGAHPRWVRAREKSAARSAAQWMTGVRGGQFTDPARWVALLDARPVARYTPVRPPRLSSVYQTQRAM